MNPLIQTEKSSRWRAMLVATVVAIITSAVVANATQTITTPNAAFISYNLATGANSAAITPATDKSVHVMGCCTTSGERAVGQVSLMHSSISPGCMTWEGLESSGMVSTAFTQSSGCLTPTAAMHVVFIDYNHVVDIELASGGNTIFVHNAGGFGTVAGNVTLVW